MGNGNINNLVPNEMRTPEERRRNAIKAGKASGKARRRKKELRECLDLLLEKKIKSANGKSMTGAEAICIKQFEKALKGDTRAFEVIRDTAGQKPIERVQVAELEQSTIDEVESIFNE